MRKKTQSNTNHITGEHNISSNGNNLTFSAEKDSNINYNKTELSNHGIIFVILLMLILAGNIIFAGYLLKRLDESDLRLKEIINKNEERVNAQLEEQTATLARILEIYRQ